MSIERFYTTTFTVTRQEWVDDKSTLGVVGTFLGHIQQATSDVLNQYEGLRLTKGWIVWCKPDTDVTEGDRLSVGDTTYDVRFVENRNVGSEGHLQLVLELNG